MQEMSYPEQVLVVPSSIVGRLVNSQLSILSSSLKNGSWEGNLLLIIFATDCRRLVTITTDPNVIHKTEGIFDVQEDLLSLM